MCPCLLNTQVASTDREKNISIPAVIFQDSAYFCAVFFKRTIYTVTQYFYHLLSLNFLHLAQLKKIYIYRLFMESTPFSIFCDTICRNHFRSSLGSFAVQFRDRLRYWDQLQAGIICGPIQYHRHCVKISRANSKK